MTEGHDHDESRLPPIPPTVSEVLGDEPVYGPMPPEELARQQEASLIALDEEIAGLEAAQRAVEEEIQEGRAGADAKEKSEHLRVAIHEAQAERNSIQQGF